MQDCLFAESELRIVITVLMSTYKEPEGQLRKSIESILNQTISNFEYLIILDNPENELHIRLIQEYEKKDSRIRFYINEKNLGLTNTLNKGLSLAKGKYVARMDADDISLPNRLEKQLTYIESNHYDLIGGITEMMDENGNRIYSIQKVPTDFEKIKKALCYGQCIAHPTWFGKKEVFDKLSGYRDMPLCEDFDFTLRAVLSGFRVSNVNETVLRYRMSKNSISRTNLFDQYLYMCYITKEYKKGNIASEEKAKRFVKEHLDKKKAENYLRSNVYFNEMLQNMTDKKVFSFIKNGFKLLFSSKYYLDKIRRFAMLSFYG